MAYFLIYYTVDHFPLVLGDTNALMPC